ncbi:hypothetical protein BOO86_17380 [Mycobacterium sp. CBMA 234]|uniref:hypothetical protein n=1 Tax=Mycolicibacterium sp. CBMA 234 TaxID=1918495 RepID=UPI0012DF1502|nr:hypothetical protein [Mycolicibacterium sp. CBMA 234]MUL66247.1 hypothetical protein [Mycolicibacterium sp. CBMA 234]
MGWLNKRAAAGFCAAAAIAGLASCTDKSAVGAPVADPTPSPTLNVAAECAHSAVTVEQLAGLWMTGSTLGVTLGKDGSANFQDRAQGQRGTWSYQPVSPNGPCVIRLRWTEGYLSGGPTNAVAAPTEWVLQPLSATPTSLDLKSVDNPSDPDEHWWRWK